MNGKRSKLRKNITRQPKFNILNLQNVAGKSVIKELLILPTSLLSGVKVNF